MAHGSGGRNRRKILCRPKSETVSVIGLGRIGQITLRAFKEVLPNIKTVKIFDPAERQREKFIDTMKEIVPNVEFVVSKSYKDACEDADVVTSCAPIVANPERPVKTNMLKKDVFCMTSDYCSTFDAETVKGGTSFVCDDKGQYLWTQAQGMYFQNGYPAKDEIYADMSEIVTGKKPAVQSGHRTCLFMGITVNDVMTAKLIMEKAKAQNVGIMLKL